MFQKQDLGFPLLTYIVRVYGEMLGASYKFFYCFLIVSLSFQIYNNVIFI